MKSVWSRVGHDLVISVRDKCGAAIRSPQVGAHLLPTFGKSQPLSLGNVWPQATRIYICLFFAQSPRPTEFREWLLSLTTNNSDLRGHLNKTKLLKKSRDDAVKLSSTSSHPISQQEPAHRQLARKYNSISRVLRFSSRIVSVPKRFRPNQAYILPISRTCRNQPTASSGVFRRRPEGLGLAIFSFASSTNTFIQGWFRWLRTLRFRRTWWDACNLLPLQFRTWHCFYLRW